MDLASLQKQLSDQQGKEPPVDRWNPDFCGDIDMQIKHDGSWWYMGTPIGRKALVKLFASVLKLEGDDYFLVTPVEKVGIQVEDVPFLVTQWHQQDSLLFFTTNTEDLLQVGPQHPIDVKPDPKSGEPLPYVLVRRNLWARLHQNVFYQLVNLAQERSDGSENQLVIQSGEHTYSLGAF